jgi:hypothetical protein
LYRATGEVLPLDAKSAIYTVWSTVNPTNQHKVFDIPVTAFTDPATRKVWIGWVNSGDVETNEYENDDHTVSTNYLTYTNLYFETDSEIFKGDNVMNDGTFNWDESMIKQAQPGEGLDAVIDRFEKNVGGAWPFSHTHGESRFSDYFQDDFFSSGNLGSQSTPIQRIEVSNGKLRLDFNSQQYKTTASVWLDLKTFQVRQIIEYRPVHFNLETFYWGVVPALIAIMTAAGTLLLTRKARSVAHGILSVIVLICIIWSWFMLYRICILGAWPTHLPFFHPILVLGDWGMYLPVIGIAVATVFTVAQALLVRPDKQK